LFFEPMNPVRESFVWFWLLYFCCPVCLSGVVGRVAGREIVGVWWSGEVVVEGCLCS